MNSFRFCSWLLWDWCGVGVEAAQGKFGVILARGTSFCLNTSDTLGASLVIVWNGACWEHAFLFWSVVGLYLG